MTKLQALNKQANNLNAPEQSQVIDELRLMSNHSNAVDNQEILVLISTLCRR